MTAAATLAGELGARPMPWSWGVPGVSAAAGELGSYGAAVVRVAEDSALENYHPDGYPRW
jgi:hypothetical protein